MAGRVSRLRLAFKQFSYLNTEVNKFAKGKWQRKITCWGNPSWGVIFAYRLNRFFYLLMGEAWAVVRVILPIHIFLRILYGPHEIHYRAEIGRGLKVLHPSLGVVISGIATIGRNLTLVGGNCIGYRGKAERGQLVLGDNVFVGAGAIILGPVQVGNDVKIGAGSVVTDDIFSKCNVAGVPARKTKPREEVLREMFGG